MIFLYALVIFVAVSLMITGFTFAVAAIVLTKDPLLIGVFMMGMGFLLLTLVFGKKEDK